MIREVRNFSVLLLLISLVFFSSVASFMIASNTTINDFEDIYIEIYTIGILYFLIRNYKYYKGVTNINFNVDSKKIKTFSFYLMAFASIAFLINIFIVYKSIGLISTDINITAYKNEGEAEEMIKTWVNPSLLTFSHFITPISYTCLAFHFYYMIKSNIWLSRIYFLLSLNIPLHGLHALSRFSTITFILVYFCLLIFCYPTFTLGVKQNIKKYGFLFGSIIIILMGVITTSRFSDSYYYENRRPTESLIQDKSLFSIFHYYSQWNQNNNHVLKEYEYNKSWHGQGSTPLIYRIRKSLGDEPVPYMTIRKNSMGAMGTKFTGVVSTLVYDFGFLGTIFFALIFGVIIKNLAPKNGIVEFKSFMFFGLLIQIPLMFFTNNVMSYLLVNLGFIYALIFRFLFKYVYNRSQ